MGSAPINEVWIRGAPADLPGFQIGGVVRGGPDTWRVSGQYSAMAEVPRLGEQVPVRVRHGDPPVARLGTGRVTQLRLLDPDTIKVTVEGTGMKGPDPDGGSSDLRMAVQMAHTALSQMPAGCRYHGTNFDQSGWWLGYPACDSCRLPYLVSVALGYTTRVLVQAAGGGGQT